MYSFTSLKKKNLFEFVHVYLEFLRENTSVLNCVPVLLILWNEGRPIGFVFDEVKHVFDELKWMISSSYMHDIWNINHEFDELFSRQSFKQHFLVLEKSFQSALHRSVQILYLIFWIGFDVLQEGAKVQWCKTYSYWNCKTCTKLIAHSQASIA